MVLDPRIRFEELYRAHCGAVRAFVHRRAPASIADDVVADVFVHAWRRVDQVPSDELSWLLGITRGILANRRRAEARRTALQERLQIGAVVSQEAPLDECGGDSVVMDALATLSDRDRELLLLVAWDGLDRAQAARVLGITTSSFAVRLHRARRRLARALEMAEGNPPTCPPLLETL